MALERSASTGAPMTWTSHGIDTVVYVNQAALRGSCKTSIDPYQNVAALQTGGAGNLSWLGWLICPLLPDHLHHGAHKWPH